METLWRGSPPITKNPIRFFLFASRPHWKVALISIVCIVAAALINAFTPYVFKIIVNAGLEVANGSYTPLIHAVLLYVGISLATNLLWRGSGFAGSYWVTGMRATARDALTSHLTLHSYKYFSDRFAGSLLSKIKQAADGVKDLGESFLWQILQFVVSLITSLIIVYVTSPLIGYLFIALFALLIPLNIYFSRHRIPLSMAAQAAETKLSGVTVDVLTNITSVYEYARRPLELTELRTLTAERRRLGLRNWHYGERVLLLNGLLQTLCIGGIVFVALSLLQQGAITPGDIVLFLTMIFLLQGQLTFIGSQINHITETWGNIKESLSDILEPHSVTDVSNASELMVTDGTVSFEDVSFRYEGTDVFGELTFTIPAGQKVGIVGRSGAGKSTLIKLILRHYDLQAGRIMVDGTDVAGVTKESLRAHIAIVPQEPSLFHRTIHENIAYGKPGASREDVVRAAMQAQAHEFIETLPDGYDSLVGERGIKLSGGQRQRIVIARAFLKDAKILLLDEATSALDSESEVAVQKALFRLMEGRTVLAIAHRLSTLRAMDRLIVFDKGQIVEDGTHDELLKKKGVYAELWTHQAGGFLED